MEGGLAEPRDSRRRRCPRPWRKGWEEREAGLFGGGSGNAEPRATGEAGTKLPPRALGEMGMIVSG